MKILLRIEPALLLVFTSANIHIKPGLPEGEANVITFLFQLCTKVPLFNTTPNPHNLTLITTEL
jgi:hypothetical protein